MLMPPGAFATRFRATARLRHVTMMLMTHAAAAASR